MQAAQVDADMSAFDAPNPEEAKKLEKELEKRRKEREKAEKATLPKRLQMAEELVQATKKAEKKEVPMSPEKEASLKASILRKIKAYQYEFPQRLEGVPIPKTLSAKHSLDELRAFLADVECQLGRSGAENLVTYGYVSAMSGRSEERRVGKECRL